MLTRPNVDANDPRRPGADSVGRPLPRRSRPGRHGNSTTSAARIAANRRNAHRGRQGALRSERSPPRADALRGGQSRLLGRGGGAGARHRRHASRSGSPCVGVANRGGPSRRRARPPRPRRSLPGRAGIARRRAPARRHRRLRAAGAGAPPIGDPRLRRPRAKAMAGERTQGATAGGAGAGERTHPWRPATAAAGERTQSGQHAACGSKPPSQPRLPIAPGQEGCVGAVCIPAGKEGACDRAATMAARANEIAASPVAQVGAPAPALARALPNGRAAMTDQTVTTKPAQTGYRAIGKPLVRKEDARLTTGHGRFSDDFSLPGQAYAVMVRSPHPHARILGIDATRAKALPGVLGVFTGADCLADGLKPIPHDPVPKTKSDMKLVAPGGGILFIGPHLLLPVDKARHVGEAVAMVVAETVAQALDAAEAVEVDYEPLPGVYHSEAAMLPGAPVLWDEVPDNILVDTLFGDRAATDKGFAEADRVIAMDFHIDRVIGLPLETLSAL